MNILKLIHIRVVARNQEGYLVRAQARSHELVLDEPRESGGTDQGPTPLEALLAALAGCLMMTLRLHAQRSRVDIESIEAVAEAYVDPRGFIGKAKPGLQDTKLRLVVRSSADPEKVKELVHNAEKYCPVADTLRSETSVKLEIEIKE